MLYLTYIGVPLQLCTLLKRNPSRYFGTNLLIISNISTPVKLYPNVCHACLKNAIASSIVFSSSTGRTCVAKIIANPFSLCAAQIRFGMPFHVSVPLGMPDNGSSSSTTSAARLWFTGASFMVAGIPAGAA